jgi:hypothetical protein
MNGNVGINLIYDFPKVIAELIGLDKEKYSGHTIRRTSVKNLKN